MKKLMNSVLMTIMVLPVCSCGNNGDQQRQSNNENSIDAEKYFSYQLLGTNRYDK